MPSWKLEYPPAFLVADDASIEAQAGFVWSTRTQLVLLVLASGLGAFSWAVARFEVGALVAGVAFLAAAGLRLLVLRLRPHERWYEGRAVAESLKTSAWRYAVGADPFSLNGRGEARQAFIDQSRSLFSGVATILPPSDPDSFAPTLSMGELRTAPLDVRRASYLDGRIEDQFRWYSSKAEWNRRRAAAWSRLVLGLQLLAATGAFLRGFGVIAVDLFGLAGALVASAAAWLETKQHASLASAYAVAAQELGRIRSLLPSITEEDDWARFVAESEEAISREHTLWKVTSTERGPVALT